MGAIETCINAMTTTATLIYIHDHLPSNTFFYKFGVFAEMSPIMITTVYAQHMFVYPHIYMSVARHICEDIKAITRMHDMGELVAEYARVV